MKNFKNSFLIILGILLTGCNNPSPASFPTQKNVSISPKTLTEKEVKITNPASQNCNDLGGTLKIEERGDQGEYGICVFEKNKQCEEWALKKGDCPKEGIDISEYKTPESRYCVLTGGTYSLLESETDSSPEKGKCTLKDGSFCEAIDYFNGNCDYLRE